MTKRTLFIILGLWIAVVPFLGFPTSWKNGIIIVSGLFIATFSFLHGKRYTKNN